MEEFHFLANEIFIHFHCISAVCFSGLIQFHIEEFCAQRFHLFTGSRAYIKGFYLGTQPAGGSNSLQACNTCPDYQCLSRFDCSCRSYEHGKEFPYMGCCIQDSPVAGDGCLRTEHIHGLCVGRAGDQLQAER